MAPADLELQRATPADRRVVRDVRLRALKDAPEAFGSTYAREEAFTEDDWKGRLVTRDHVTYLARLGDRTVGVVGGWRSGAGVQLVAMWVAPAMRGRGVAEAHVDAVVEWAAAIGEKRIYLYVKEGNDSARRLYERCGFTDTGQREPFWSNPELTLIVMELTLP